MVDEVINMVVAFEAQGKQSDFPIVYASGWDGWCVVNLDDERTTLSQLLDTVLRHVPAPDVEVDAPFAMLATLLDSDQFLGRCLTGRVMQGTARVNEAVRAINLEGKQVEVGRLTKLLRFDGTSRVPVNEVKAGDIVCIAGLDKASD